MTAVTIIRTTHAKNFSRFPIKRLSVAVFHSDTVVTMRKCHVGDVGRGRINRRNKMDLEDVLLVGVGSCQPSCQT